MNELCKNMCYFSSDWNCGSIVYGDKDGSLYFYSEHRMCKINQNAVDSLPKNAKFYPFDDLAITTTDGKGLRIWDTSTSEMVYKYPEEALKSHTYSDTGVLASFDDYNIKLYDLRMRYRAQNINCDGLEALGWTGSFIYGFDGCRVKVFDARMLRPARIIKDVHCFQTYRNGIFMANSRGIACTGCSKEACMDEECILLTGTNRENSVVAKTDGKTEIFVFECDQVERREIAISSGIELKNVYLYDEFVQIFTSCSFEKIPIQDFYCPL